MKIECIGLNLTMDKAQGEIVRWWADRPIGDAGQPALVAS
jgi:hypothetical protein